MTLTNYWWLLIWLFVGGGILTILIPKQRELVEGKMEERWSSLAAFLLILPYIFGLDFVKIYGTRHLIVKLLLNVPHHLEK